MAYSLSRSVPQHTVAAFFCESFIFLALPIFFGERQDSVSPQGNVLSDTQHRSLGDEHSGASVSGQAGLMVVRQ
jgi:hypothetical protein